MGDVAVGDAATAAAAVVRIYGNGGEIVPMLPLSPPLLWSVLSLSPFYLLYVDRVFFFRANVVIILLNLLYVGRVFFSRKKREKVGSVVGLGLG